MRSTRFCAVAQFERHVVYVPHPVGAHVAVLAEGEVVLLPAEEQRVPGRSIVGATLRVRSVEVARAVLADAGTGLRAARGGQSVFVAPDAANGLWIEFREETGRR